MNMLEYAEHPDGFALLQDEGEGVEPLVVYTSSEISIAYTVCRTGGFITHRHGRPQEVEAWAIAQRKSLLETLGKRHPLLLTMVPRVVTSSKWDIDDLNFAAWNINGLNRLAKKLSETLGLEL